MKTSLFSRAAVASVPTADWYARAWALWAAGVGLSFAALETAALRGGAGQGRTLSAQLRRRRRTCGFALAVGAGWLVHHVVWQGSEEPGGAVRTQEVPAVPKAGATAIRYLRVPAHRPAESWQAA